MGDGIDTLISIVEKNWHRPQGLIAAILATFLFIPAVIPASTYHLEIVATSDVLLSLALVVLWFLLTRPPRTPNGKVGFALSLCCNDDKALSRIREDFVQALHRQLHSGQTGSTFHFLEIPQYIAEKCITQANAQDLRRKTRARFVLYGRVRLRGNEGKERYTLELGGIVAHRPIPSAVSQKLGQEFGELLPRKMFFEKEDELHSFQLISDMTEIVAKYIIGIAAALSGDYDYAEKLFIDAQACISTTTARSPAITEIGRRIPKRLSEVIELRMIIAYESWVSTNEDSHIKTMGELLHRAQTIEASNTHRMLNLTAIYVFLSTRDATGAMSILGKIKKSQRDASWHFNQAFLWAYQGDLKESIRHYRNGLECPDITVDVVTKVEDFICRILRLEKDKIQLHYCLGFFNWKVKGDHLQAVKDFNNFMTHSMSDKYAGERELARKWSRVIEASAA